MRLPWQRSPPQPAAGANAPSSPAASDIQSMDTLITLLQNNAGAPPTHSQMLNNAAMPPMQMGGPARMLPQNVMAQNAWNPMLMRHNAGGQGPQLLRIVVAKELANLSPDRRHLVVDRLNQDPSFSCLFSYVAGPNAASSCLAASRTMATDAHKRILAGVIETIHAIPEPQPTAAALPPAPDAAPAPADHQAAISLTCTPEFESYEPGSGSTMRMVVSLQATSQVTQQGHVALTSVLDVSGSMSGQRIELLKETNHFLVKQVTSQDLLGFISYSDDAFADVPLMRMTPSAKAFAHTILESLQASGSTALCDGTLQGMRQQLETLADEVKLAKGVFLCTDGQANVGYATADTILPALHAQQKATGRPCTIHTFGIGHGHSAELLQAISESMSGSYFYLKDLSDVGPAYGEALGGLMSVVAKTVRVRICVPGDDGSTSELPGVSIKSGGQVVSPASVQFNDIYAEESREMLVCLPLPPAPPAATPAAAAAAVGGGAGDVVVPGGNTATEQPGAAQAVARVLVTYTDPVLGKDVSCSHTVTIRRDGRSPAAPAHPLVAATAARYTAADVIERAQELQAAGDTTAAVGLLQEFASDAAKQQKSDDLPASLAVQWELLSSQTRVVAEQMEAAKASKATATLMMQGAVSKAASNGLRVQRASTVGATSVLPQAAMWTNKSKAAMRDTSSVCVDQSMMSRGYGSMMGPQDAAAALQKQSAPPLQRAYASMMGPQNMAALQKQSAPPAPQANKPQAAFHSQLPQIQDQDQE